MDIINLDDKNTILKEVDDMKYRVMVIKYGYAVVEAESESEALECINNMDDRNFDWSEFDDGQVVEEIDFDSLPNQFVLKCTHDSGGVVICRNKQTYI